MDGVRRGAVPGLHRGRELARRQVTSPATLENRLDDTRRDGYAHGVEDAMHRTPDLVATTELGRCGRWAAAGTSRTGAAASWTRTGRAPRTTTAEMQRCNPLENGSPGDGHMTQPLEVVDLTELAQRLHDAACHCGDRHAGQSTYWLTIARAAVQELRP